MKWPDVDEMDGETSQLLYLVDHGWDWEWPGWGWVAGQLNDEFGNDRTPRACAQKYDRETKKLQTIKQA